MSRLCLLLVFATIFGFALGADKEICCDDVGCFSNGSPFNDQGKIATLPDCPDKLNTRYWLYTRKNTDEGQELKVRDVSSISNSHYDGAKSTKFIVHGFIDSPALGPWMHEMAVKFLTHEDCNAIVVDWHVGGRKMNAMANTRTVGAELAQLSQLLVDEKGGDFGKFHLLGHSLGGHLVGYAGERMKGLGRITGLDPAGPYFENMTAAVRLDESDAMFVDVVHTDMMTYGDNDRGMGISQAIGHVDVYANGGWNQPGCGEKRPMMQILEDGLVQGLRNVVACDHCRSYEYVTETIGSDCPWRSYNCKSWDEFKTGLCLHNCPDSGDKTKMCNGVGTLATKPSDGSVNNMFYMSTGDKSSFCQYHFHVQLKIASQRNDDQMGSAWVKFTDENGQVSGYHRLGEADFLMKSRDTFDFLVTTRDQVRSVTALEFKWEHEDKWQVMQPSIYVDSVTVFSGEFQAETKFCDTQGKLKSKSSHTYTDSC